MVWVGGGGWGWVEWGGETRLAQLFEAAAQGAAAARERAVA